MYDATSTHLDLERSGVDTAVLPVGAIEQHGQHLPLSVDWFQGDVVARVVAERVDAYLLPGMPFGCSQAHAGFRGSIFLAPETLGAVVKDVATSLLEQGFRRIAVLNFHGGNLILKLAVRDLNLSQSLGKIVLVNPAQDAGAMLNEILDGYGDEQHAGELETSIMMYAAARPGGAVASRPRPRRWARLFRLPAHEGVLPRRRLGTLQPGHCRRRAGWPSRPRPATLWTTWRRHSPAWAYHPGRPDRRSHESTQITRITVQTNPMKVIDRVLIGRRPGAPLQGLGRRPAPPPTATSWSATASPVAIPWATTT